MGKAPKPKEISRSYIERTIGEALRQPGILMTAPIATTFPGLNPLAYVWGTCRIYGEFAKDGMDRDAGGLAYASVVRKNPKTLGEFERNCIEPWYVAKKWKITLP